MKTLQRCGQVLLTYFDRTAFRVMFLVILLGGGGYLVLNWFRDAYSMQVFSGSALRDPTLGLLFFIDFLAHFVPFVLLIVFVIVQVTHVREQMDRPQAVVIPGYIAPHLIVGGIVFFAVGAFATGVAFSVNWMTYRGDNHPDLLGTFAFALGLMTLTAWFANARSPWFAAAVIPLLLLAVQNHRLANWVEDFLRYHWEQERNLVQDVCLLGVDLLALIALLSRLSRLPLESDAKATRRRTAPKTESESEPPRLPTARHTPLTATLVRAWHLRAGVLPRGAAWAVAGVLFVLLSFVTSVARPGPADLLRSLILATIVPGVVVSFSWLQRWRNIASESLFPGRRRSFIRELALANAIDLAEFWVATTAAVMAPVLIWDRGQLFNPLLPVTLVASAAMQVLVFGGTFLSATNRPSLPYSTVAVLLATLIPLGFAWGDEPTLTARGLVVVSLIEMGAGLFLAGFAYTAWRRVDLA